MNDFNSGMFDSLGLLYKSHGGLRALVKSSYFHLAIVVSALAWRTAATAKWSSLAVGALPTIAGFSIAAFAILFAVLDEKSRIALSIPEPKLGGRSPLLILAASVSHAVVTQLLALIYAFIYDSKPFPQMLDCFPANKLNLIFSSIGLILTMYAIVLVLAAVLSIFRLLEIKSRISLPNKPKGP